MDVLEEIRSSCAAVAAGAAQVRIDPNRLRSYAEELAATADTDDVDPGRTPLGDHEATAAFVVSLDAINFGSGYFPHLHKRPGLSGYYTVATAFREFADTEGPITAAGLAGLDSDRVAAVLGQPLDDPFRRELMGLFAEALVTLGRHVLDHHDGSFLALIEAADGSAATLVAELDTVGFFHDVATWRGRAVPLYKRAQIAAYDLAVAFDHEGPGAFVDLHRLTMFADNLVPHVLRLDGVVAFAPELVARIEAGDDITAGSEAEVEIRAVAVHAVELMVAELDRLGQPTTAGALDGRLWRRGGGAAYKARPRHRTRTTAY